MWKFESPHLDNYFSSYSHSKFLFLINIENGISVIFWKRAVTFFTGAFSTHRGRQMGPLPRRRATHAAGPRAGLTWGQPRACVSATSACWPAAVFATAPPIQCSPERVVCINRSYASRAIGWTKPRFEAWPENTPATRRGGGGVRPSRLRRSRERGGARGGLGGRGAHP